MISPEREIQSAKITNAIFDKGISYARLNIDM